VSDTTDDDSSNVAGKKNQVACRSTDTTTIYLSFLQGPGDITIKIYRGKSLSNSAIMLTTKIKVFENISF
jgi:hypothetical protein